MASAFSFMNAAAASEEEEKTSGSLDRVKLTAIEGKEAAPKKKKKKKSGFRPGFGRAQGDSQDEPSLMESIAWLPSLQPCPLAKDRTVSTQVNAQQIDAPTKRRSSDAASPQQVRKIYRCRLGADRGPPVRASQGGRGAGAGRLKGAAAVGQC